MNFKLSVDCLTKAAAKCNELSDIESIIRESKSPKEELKQLLLISDIIQSHGVGHFLGSNVIHKHFDQEPGQLVVCEQFHLQEYVKMSRNGEVVEVEKLMASQVYLFDGEAEIKKIGHVEVIEVKPENYRVAKFSREVEEREDKDILKIIPRVLKWDQEEWVLLEALRVSDEDLSYRPELFPTADEMKRLDHCLTEVALYLQQRNLSDTYGVAFRLNIDQALQSQRLSEDRGYPCEYTLSLTEDPSVPDFMRHAQIVIYQSTPKYMRETMGISDEETSYEEDEYDHQPFTTTIFPNEPQTCKNCSLGCEEEGHYKMSLIFEI
jgi:hypothetical protein